MLETLVPDQLWTATRPLRRFGLRFATRMTVVRVNPDSLWIHSPIDADEALREQLRGLGLVRTVVAPNRWHHLFLPEFVAHYPEAKVYVAPGLPLKRPDLRYDGILSEEPPLYWSGVIQPLHVRGHERRDEFVFLHRPTRTLIVTDLLESVHRDAPMYLRLASRLAGMYERPAPPPDVRFLPDDRELLRASIERILAWDFDRIVLAHGEIVKEGGKDVLREAFARLLQRRRVDERAPEGASPA